MLSQIVPEAVEKAVLSPHLTPLAVCLRQSIHIDATWYANG